MDLIWTVLIGFVAGLVAKLLAPGAGRASVWVTAALGIGGSLAAAFIGHVAGLYKPGQSAGFIAALLGAVVVLLGYQVVVAKP